MGKDARGTTERMASNNLSLFSIFVFSRGGFLKVFCGSYKTWLQLVFCALDIAKSLQRMILLKKRFWKWTCKLF